MGIASYQMQASTMEIEPGVLRHEILFLTYLVSPNPILFQKQSGNLRGITRKAHLHLAISRNADAFRLPPT